MSYNPEVKCMFLRTTGRALGRASQMLDNHGRSFLARVEILFHKETKRLKKAGIEPGFGGDCTLTQRVGSILGAAAVSKDMDNVADREDVFDAVYKAVQGAYASPITGAALSELQTRHAHARTQLQAQLRQMGITGLLRLERHRSVLEGSASPAVATALHTLEEHALLPLANFQAWAQWPGLSTLQRRLSCALHAIDAAIREQTAVLSPALTGDALFDRLLSISMPLGFYEGDHLVVYDYDRLEVKRQHVLSGAQGEVAKASIDAWWTQRRFGRTHEAMWSNGGEDFNPFCQTEDEESESDEDNNTEENNESKPVSAASSISEKDSGIENGSHIAVSSDGETGSASEKEESEEGQDLQKETDKELTEKGISKEEEA